jgi:hypothetical protein
MSGLTLITGERPDLSRGRSNLSNTSRQQDDDDDCYHNAGTCNALCGVIEHLYHGLSCWCVENTVQIAKAKNKCNANDEKHDCVECYSRSHHL